MTSSSSQSNAAPLLRAGHNCWRVEHARRFAMLVDADAYFRAVRDAILKARRSIFILSWDLDSRVRLVPEGANDGYPEPLADFLHAVVSDRPSLQAYVLNWDFAMLYALEREWLPVYKMGWRTHRRLHFAMDARHPVGGSHHQKIVVIDDCLAFVGGLDLTRSRWDTPEHAPDNPLRCDPDGTPFSPFHDVQAMVDGDCALSLGVLCRLRWLRATGKHAVAVDEHRHDYWPACVSPDLTDVKVGISRTEPLFEREPAVLEVRQLHLDAIARARSHLFFENQYFTSGLIADALGKRLQEPVGPEVVVISPHNQSGWLEESTMGVLRARMQKRLREADRQGRYRLYCPHLPALENTCLNVHSKVFSVDDEVLSIGSANLSSRSMALDTECNLTIEAQGSESERSRIANAIARMRARLLGEHLAVAPEKVMQVHAMQGSLIGGIEMLLTSGRSLRQFDPQTTPELDALIPENALFDPERPIDPDRLVAEFVPKDAREPAPRRMAGLVLLACALVVLALAWRFTPLREWINPSTLISVGQAIEDAPFTPLLVMGCYVLAGFFMLPVTLLIAVSGIVFGPFWGGLYGICGALASAAASYGLGAWLGRDTVRRVLGPRVNGLSRRIARRGIVAMMVIRVVPIAPYTIVNVVAGASHIRLRDFLIGTVLGMLPGVALTVTFAHNLAEVIRRPSPGTLAVLAVVVVLLVGFAFLLQRLLTRTPNPGAR